MVSLKMDNAAIHGNNDHSVAVNASKRTKKSLRLSEKKEMVIKKIKEKEKEKQRNKSEKKDKDEDNVAVDVDEDETFSKAKQKRHWEYWAKVDKDVFFEAICEFGKDFDKIYSFMERKAKGRAKSVKDCEPRNKDQIRYFYYRTWKQISKAITLQPAESKRVNHEIYCMICYGELRKKDVVGFGQKDLKKLDELVTTGSTAVRYRGRKVRVKPPTCKFLKRLSDDEEKSGREIESIPEIIDVELYPKSNKAWSTAQCIASNPRLRLPNLPVTVKLRSLLKLLQKRFENVSSDLLPDSTCIVLHPPSEFNNDLSLSKESKKEFMRNKEPSTNSITDVTCDANSKDLSEQNLKNSEETPHISPVSVPDMLDSATTIDVQNQNSTTSTTVEKSSKSPLSKDAACSSITEDSSNLLDSGNIPSNDSTLSCDHQTAADIDECQTDVTEDTADGDSSSIFPITSDNVAEKDLQICYLELRRPDKIRLEYDWQQKTQLKKPDQCPSLHKLMMLSQRDLEKMIRCQMTSQNKASSSFMKTNPATKSFLSPKSCAPTRSQQTTKTRLVNPSEVPNTSVHVQSITVASNTKLPSICFPALTNTIRPVFHRKVTPRLKTIQPASKTLMAKAVAVNIVPQPAQLVQFGQMPAVSAQLVNSGSASITACSTLEIPSAAETSSIFSSPSTESLSSPITIWSSPLVNNEPTDQVQVEIIQEGSGNKTSAKRLHPTSIEVITESAAKRPYIAGSDETALTTDFTEVDLDFLSSSASNDSSKLSSTDSVNLSSILSGLTKNLRKNEEASVTASQQTSQVVTTTAVRASSPLTVPSFTITSQVVSTVTPNEEKSSPPQNSVTADSSAPSVLLTPVKNVNRTPSKNETNLESMREQPVNFGSQWFSEDITEISLGGLLDVGNMKEQTKNSDSSQTSDISIGNLLNAVEKKREIDDSNTQSSEISIGTLLGVSEKVKKDDKSESQQSQISIGSLLGVSTKKSALKSSTGRDSSPIKAFNSDSLLMKPEGDPVIAFESLMNESSIDYINKFKDLTAKFKANSDSHSRNQNNASTQQNQSETNRPSSENSANVEVSVASNTKDPTLPVYRSEDSVGLLDDLSFVLTADNNSSDSVKAFS